MHRECATTSAAVVSELSQISVGEGQEEMNIDELVDGGEKSVLDDGNIFKVPSSKRKTRRDLRTVNSKKGRKSDTDGFSDTDSERELSDASIPDGQKSNGYSLGQIRNVLEVTKGKIDVDDFFPNQSLFVHSVQWLMRQRGADGLKDKEIYRLRKLVHKVKAQHYK